MDGVDYVSTMHIFSKIIAIEVRSDSVHYLVLVLSMSDAVTFSQSECPR